MEPQRLVQATALSIALSLALVACPETPPPDTLLLEVTSDAPTGGGAVEGLRVLFAQDDVRFPVDPASAAARIQLGGADPVAGPVYVSLDYQGATFGPGPVELSVNGVSGGITVSAWQGTVNLTDKRIVKVRLRALGDACDVDGDGFLDCSVSGCCSGDSTFSDCEPDDPMSNPFAPEPACEPCDDTRDQNCDGVDQPCVDADNDGLADCLETCGLDDPDSGPGLPELCDGKDNDCDGLTDEDFTLGGVAVGASCGLGICAGGQVVCTSITEVACSTDGDAVEEVCDGALDDDCDGVVDEGCAVGADVDGDGYTEAAGDCDDYDAGVFPGAPEPCCPDFARESPEAQAACDRDCDSTTITYCDPGDVDGDGVAAPSDCDDSDPNVYPGAPEQCGDGIDQDCFGGDLACDGLVDADGDGFSPPEDCNDNDPTIGPGVAELCDAKDNDCDGLTDEGNPEGGTECGELIGVCVPGTLVCDNSEGAGELACLGTGQGPEICDGLDNDCDGDVDEDFTYDGAAIGEPCQGVGACGTGQVQCSNSSPEATCSSNPDGAASQAQPEVCDSLDNDCDGELNEGLTDVADSTCLTQGVCGDVGAVIVAICNPDTSGTWSCNYDGVPGYSAGFEPLCDGLDNDCDGEVDEDFGAGGGCEGDDPDMCANGVITCDGTQLGTFCDETNASNSEEVCDGLDNDCDGETDEDFTLLGTPCDGPDTDQCANGVYECADDASGVACKSETVVDIADICDNIDNDCDGETDESYTLLGQPCDGPDADECANGVYTCAPSGTQVQCASETVTDIAETCNNIDDDCDGLTDEDYLDKGQPCDGDDDDLCENGVFVCTGDGTGVECGSEFPANIPDLCDGIDNDCDGSIDEAFSAGGTVVFVGATNPADNGKVLGDSCGAGACAGGVVVCAASTIGHRCSTDTNEGTEVCNAADDDCNGVADDPFVDGTVTFDGGPNSADANKVLGESCGAGACASGTVVCDGNSALTCDSLGNVGTEVCDDTDNDCDGALNEGLTNVADSDCLQAGVCASGVSASCNQDATGTWACNYSGVSNYASDETGAAFCDDLDNDCDGLTDENHPTLGDACDGGDSDQCTNGTLECNAGGTGVVCGAESPADIAEVCDGQDNDCDGVTDEDDVCCTATAPFEVCGDCEDNDCDTETDESGCYHERRLTIGSKESAVPAGFAVSMTIDHAALVAAGESNANGADLRIYYDDGGTLVELDRVLDPESAWNQADTVVWFAAYAAIAASSSDDGYRLYTTNGIVAGAAAANERNIFHFADFFDRADNEDINAGVTGSNWVTTASSGDTDIASNALFMEGADAPNDPVVEHTFTALSGTFEWRFGFNWERDSEGQFRTEMVLGDGLAAAPPASFSSQGVGPHLAWGGSSGGFSVNEGYGHVDGGTITELGTVSGVHPFAIRGDTATGTYSIAVDGASVASGVDFDGTPTQLTNMRFVGWRFCCHLESSFTYVMLRQTLATPPEVTVGAKTSCLLDDTGLVARYYMDEATSGQTGPVFDSGPATAVDLSITTDGAEPVYVDDGGNRGLRFDTVGSNARVIGSIDNTKIAALHGAEALTIEFVADIDAGSDSSNPTPLWIGPNSSYSDARLHLIARGSNAMVTRWRSIGSAGVGFGPQWNSAWLNGRHVYHLVWDTAQASQTSRIRLYRDGVLIPVTIAGSMPSQNDQLFIDNDLTTATLIFGNVGGGGFGMDGTVFYGAIYDGAMTATQISTNAAILLNNDDTP